ncbi:cupin domain-containing protein [Roseixanthobacter pseudopolyaromaticivorans]|uniref:hypothetical protein n=1 Tax=Xanthobacteraceae TaxID=335928 RepID=UPI0037264CA3
MKIFNQHTELRPAPDWPEAIRDELGTNTLNGCVGQILVSESERVRVWSLRLTPGERVPFHRHVLDYFWTVLTEGRARSHFGDGSTAEASYRAGDTKHMTYGAGEFMLHDLENIGSTNLIFTTVEFLDSSNPALPLPERIKRAKAA